jgi:hypothetical protein
VWVGDTPEAFAAGVATLLADSERRAQMARAAYHHAVRNFDWRAIGEKQRALLRELLYFNSRSNYISNRAGRTATFVLVWFLFVFVIRICFLRSSPWSYS